MGQLRFPDTTMAVAPYPILWSLESDKIGRRRQAAVAGTAAQSVVPALCVEILPAWWEARCVVDGRAEGLPIVRYLTAYLAAGSALGAEVVQAVESAVSDPALRSLVDENVNGIQDLILWKVAHEWFTFVFSKTVMAASVEPPGPESVLGRVRQPRLEAIGWANRVLFDDWSGRPSDILGYLDALWWTRTILENQTTWTRGVATAGRFGLQM